MTDRRTLLHSALLLAGVPGALRSAFAAFPTAAPDAFDTFEAAAGKMVQTDTIIDITTAQPKRAYSDAEKAALLHANADALALARRGLSLPYAAPPFRSSTQPTPYFRQFRALAHLMTLHGEVCLAQGDAAGAMRSYLDAIQLGQKIGGRGTPILARLVGVTCQTIAQRRAWRAVDTLSAEAAKSSARRLETLFRQRVSYAENLREEKSVGQALTVEAFRKKDPTLPKLLAHYGSRSNIAAAYDTYIDSLIRRAQGRYGVTDLPGTPPPPRDPINDKVANTLWRVRFTVANIEQTQNALLLTILALRAYRLEHRRYPATLAALCPTYLHQIPEDEFATRGPLRYRLSGHDAYVLYSVGPDGRDDGGRPIDNPGTQTDFQRRLVQAGSKGDIVAGVN